MRLKGYASMRQSDNALRRRYERGSKDGEAVLFLVMGASGSGKSSCLAGLKQQRSHIDWRDFDDAPQFATSPVDRKSATEYWLRLAVENQAKGISTGIAGTVVLGEVLACPSAISIEGIHALLLDCSDVLRIERIRARDGDQAKGASQEMLCWAAWLRMHASDPQWRQDVIQAESAIEMNWHAWSSWQKGDARWNVHVLDNSSLTIEETTNALLPWIDEGLFHPSCEVGFSE